MPPVVCKPLHGGNTEIEFAGVNAILDPAEMSQLIVDMAAAAIRAHQQSGRPTPRQLEEETKYPFILPSSIGLGPCAAPNHDCLIIHFGEVQVGVAIPTARLKSLGEALIAASKDRSKPQ